MLTTVVDMIAVLDDACRGTESPVFEDSFYARHRLAGSIDNSVNVEVLTDWIKDRGARCFYVSASVLEDRNVRLDFPDAEVVCRMQGTLIARRSKGELLWLCGGPSLRTYDEQGRLLSNAVGSFDTVQSAPLSAEFYCKTAGRLEFAVLLFEDGSESVYRELTDCAPLEIMPIMKDDWLRYTGAASVWNYLINGKVYSTQHLPVRKAWNSQNLAHAIYCYLSYLRQHTGKRIYAIMRDLVAYAVALSLPEDGRWRHGSWTDLMETHMVHQVSGIHVLMSYYEDTGRAMFVQKARCVADYLLGRVDRLDDGNTWFLHDSLEESRDNAKYHYSSIILSNAFGKSDSNTLTLNSHIWTIIALQRLNELAADEQYEAAIASGLISLRRMLEAKPFSICYSIVYWPWDVLIKMTTATRNGLARKILKWYEDRLKQTVLPAFKKRYPRFIMPTGFSERDLCHSHLSHFYHLLNVKDFLVLYSVRREEWLGRVIRKCMRHILRSGLARYEAVYGSRAVVFLDVLLLYSALFDEKHLRHLAAYLKYFTKMKLPVQTDLLADPLVANPCVQFRVDTDDVLLLAPAHDSRFVAVIINLVDTEVRAVIHTNGVDLCNFEIVDDRQISYSAKREVVVPGDGYLRIVRKNG